MMWAMGLRGYFFGQRFTLRSPLRVEQVAERINCAAGSMLWPFSFGVIGGARFGRISLAYRGSIIDYSAKPRLTGRLSASRGGTELRVRFGTPASVLVFFVVWCSILLATLALTMASIFSDEHGPYWENQLPFLFVIPMFLAMPFLMHWFGCRGAQADLKEILEFLKREAQVTLLE